MTHNHVVLFRREARRGIESAFSRATLESLPLWRAPRGEANFPVALQTHAAGSLAGTNYLGITTAIYHLITPQ